MALFRRRLAEPGRHAGEQYDRHESQQTERGAPVEPGQQLGPQDRCCDGHNAEDDHHAREHAGRLLVGAKVPYDGARKDGAARHSQALHETPEDDRADRFRGHACESGHQVERKAAQEDGLPAVAVGQGAPGQLSAGDAEEEGGDRQLHGADRGVERLRHRRQGGQVGVSTEG